MSQTEGSVPAEAQRRQQEDHEDEERVALVHGGPVLARPEEHTGESAGEGDDLQSSRLSSTGEGFMRDCGIVPGPVGFKEGRIVDNGGQQGGEGPQEQRGEKLGDDRVLDRERQSCDHVFTVSCILFLSENIICLST